MTGLPTISQEFREKLFRIWNTPIETNDKDGSEWLQLCDWLNDKSTTYSQMADVAEDRANLLTDKSHKKNIRHLNKRVSGILKRGEKDPELDAGLIFAKLLYLPRAQIESNTRENGRIAAKTYFKDTLSQFSVSDIHSLFERMSRYGILEILEENIENIEDSNLKSKLDKWKELQAKKRERDAADAKVQTIYVESLLDAGEDDEISDATNDCLGATREDGRILDQEERIALIETMADANDDIIKCIVMRDKETEGDASKRDFVVIELVTAPGTVSLGIDRTQVIIPARPKTATFILKGDNVQDFESGHVDVTHAEMRDWPYVQTSKCVTPEGYTGYVRDTVLKHPDDLKPQSKRHVRWKGATQRKSQAMDSIADFVRDTGKKPLPLQQLIMHGTPKVPILGTRASLKYLANWSTLHQAIKGGKVMGWENAERGLIDDNVLLDVAIANPDIEPILMGEVQKSRTAEMLPDM